MSTTLNKLAIDAVTFFEAKLAYEIGPVGLQHALKSQEPIQIVDLRTAELYEKGHVPGALNISYEELEGHPKLDSSLNTVVYCYNLTCNLSAKAALLLAKKGYKVRELVGGWQTYEESGAPKEQLGQSSCASHKGSSCGG